MDCECTSSSECMPGSVWPKGGVRCNNPTAIALQCVGRRVACVTTREGCDRECTRSLYDFDVVRQHQLPDWTLAKDRTNINFQVTNRRMDSATLTLAKDVASAYLQVGTACLKNNFLNTNGYRKDGFMWKTHLGSGSSLKTYKQTDVRQHQKHCALCPITN